MVGFEGDEEVAIVAECPGQYCVYGCPLVYILQLGETAQNFIIGS